VARLQQKKQAAGTTGAAETTGLPCAMAFYAYGGLSPVSGLIATDISGIITP
jgi:hypothetical protein